MNFNFRKIVSALTSTALIGSTVALAAAANVPAPFVKGGAADVAVVYGSTAASSDFVAVADIQSYLQAELAKQTATGSTSSSGATATGGDFINLATTSQKLFMNSSLNAARTVLTSSELPTLLADGTATDLTGTSYKYTQKITTPATAIAFSKSGESIDPTPILDVGTTGQTTPVLNYTFTLVKNINVSDTTNVIGTSTFKILGQDFIVGASSTATNLYLYGSGQKLNIDEGVETEFTYNDTEHKVLFRGATSSTAGTIVVDGVSKSVTKGSSYKFPGEYEIYIKDIYYTTKTGTLSNIDLLVGAKSLHITNASAVRQGADDTSLTGTYGLIYSGSDTTALSSFTITQSYKDATGDYVKVGDSFVDRVFGGALKVQFGGLSPALDDASRDIVKVDTDNNIGARVAFTPDVNSAKGPYTFTFAQDGDRSSDSALTRVILADSNNYTIHVQEGEAINISEKVIINAGDKGRILRLDSIGDQTSTTSKTTFQDVISGESFEFSTGIANTSSRTIDGQTYYAQTSGSTSGSVNITWGAGAAAGNPGTQKTLFPRIKLKNGQWLSILTSTLVENLTTYSLPGVDSLTTYESGSRLTIGNLNASIITNSTTIGKLVYNYTQVNGTSPNGNNMNGTLNALSFGGTNCNFNVTLGPAILLQEEKTITGSASTNGEYICIPLSTEGTSTVQPAIGTPLWSDGTNLNSRALTSSNTKSQAVDVFGTLLERDTASNNEVTIKYPQDQMYADVLFTATGAVVEGGSSSSGTVVELGSVSVSDSEASSVSTKNLIIVGGSCVNTVAAELLGGAGCGASFTEASGVGDNEFLIETFSRTGGKVATLVAGFNAADTTNAAKYFMKQPVDTMVGKKYKGTSATSAELVTTTTNSTA